MDTTALWHLVKANRFGQYFAAKYHLQKDPTKPLVSVVTLGEIRAQAAKRRWTGAHAKVLNTMLDEVVVVEIDDGPIVESYVEIELACRSRTIGQNDMWIAATAHATKALLLTTDPDFEHLLQAKTIHGEFVDQNNPPPIPT